MMYKKVVFDGYIIGVGEVENNGNIDEAEYNRLTEILNEMPTAPEGYYYSLRAADEEWELIKKPNPMDDDIDESEAFGIIFGGDSE